MSVGPFLVGIVFGFVGMTLAMDRDTKWGALLTFLTAVALALVVMVAMGGQL